MKFDVQQNHRKSNARPRRLALALLFLFAHAFVASATHFHRAGSAGRWTTPSLSHKANAGTETHVETDETNEHAQCLLCRLQRSLVADLDRHSPDLAPPSRRFLVAPAASAVASLNIPYLVPAGRAPPLA